MTNQLLQFWLWFGLLNSLLFLPRLLLEWPGPSFFPLGGLRKGTLFERLRHLSYRYNYDLFRCCFDLVVACLLVYGCRFTNEALVWPFFIGYMVWLVYLIYFNFFDKVYQLPPLWFNDWFMLWNGLKLVVAGFLGYAVVALVVIILLGFGLFWAVGQMLNSLLEAEFGIGSLLFVVSVVSVGLFSLKRYSYDQLPQQTVQSPTWSIIQNSYASRQAKKRIRNLNIQTLRQHNIYKNVELARYPNLFFIVVESLGRLVYDDPDFSASYRKQMKVHEQKLRKAGWLMATSRSLSPIVGGASWLSYASMIYGFGIDTQGAYLALANNPEIAKYQSLFRWMQQKGYTNYHLNSLGGFEKMKIPWETYTRFYSVDEWIRYADLNYLGQHYGFGPSPPDQYALHFAENQIRENGKNPFSLFFITQNSHSPFECPDCIADDWKSLNNTHPNRRQTSKFFEKPTRTAYFNAIRYQMDCLFDFVLKAGNDDDLFVFIGDHQPPVLIDRQAPQETPVHILAKNKHRAFVDSLAEFGFVPGLLPELMSEPIRHEGFYSLFMRCLIGHFSETTMPPPYFPKGIL